VNGANLASMAWRNLWRHRRRTLLTLSSIAFGTMLAVLFTGLGDSNWSEMIGLAARLGGGHVTRPAWEADTSPFSTPSIWRHPHSAEPFATWSSCEPPRFGTRTWCGSSQESRET
jgi:hypothetical protein